MLEFTEERQGTFRVVSYVGSSPKKGPLATSPPPLLIVGYAVGG
jgi:hypothetical protein